jgi:hypothetical protein
MLYYHYTTGMKLNGLRQKGFIKTSPDKPKPRERAIVWLSTNPIWEATAAKGAFDSRLGKQRLMTKEEMVQQLGLVRFVIDSDTYPDEIIPWVRLPTAARIPKVIKDRLVKRAKLSKVDPNQWAGTLREIRLEHTQLEKWVDGEWLPFSLEEAQADISTGNSTIVDARSTMASTIQTSDWLR